MQAYTLTHLFAQNQVSLDNISTNPVSLASVCNSISITLHSLQHPRRKYNSNPAKTPYKTNSKTPKQVYSPHIHFHKVEVWLFIKFSVSYLVVIRAERGQGTCSAILSWLKLCFSVTTETVTYSECTRNSQ